jgi:hypothetical protein
MGETKKRDDNRSRYVIGVLIALALAYGWLKFSMGSPNGGILLNFLLGAGIVLVLMPKTRSLIWQKLGRESASRAPKYAYPLLGLFVLGFVLAVSSFKIEKPQARTLPAQRKVAVSTEPTPALTPPVQSKEASSPESTLAAPLPEVQPLERGVILNVEVVYLDPQSPRVQGLTNLPDGTDIMVTVENRLGYSRQQTVKVKGRRFETDPLRDGENTLAPARYNVQLVMPIPRVQTESVRAAIGEKGEKLRGPLVKTSRLGVTVEQEKAFFIGDSKEAAIRAEKVALASMKKDADYVYEGLVSLLKQGRAMTRLRESQGLHDIKRCGELMREFQAKADDIRKKAERLPQSKYAMLQLAASPVNIRYCVSCSTAVAADGCRRAEEALKRERDGR